MSLRPLAALLLLASMPALSAKENPDPMTDTQPKTHASAGGGTLLYREYRPAGAAGALPLVIFLHGSGERGDDNRAQLKHGVGDLIRLSQEKGQPLHLLAPQCPAGKMWCEVNWAAASHQTPAGPSESSRLLLEVVDGLIAEGKVDASRIHLTGLSMGGYGTWDLLVRRPEFFASALPICGGGDETKAASIARVPVWAVHGDKDGAVPVARSRNMIEALKKAGGAPLYTEVAGGGHDVWTQTYRDPKVFDWLLSHRRATPGTPAP